MLCNIATFGGGCFWGMQKWYKKEFGDAILNSTVGYIGGNGLNPTYEEVCQGKTGHAEAVQLEFELSKVTYKQLCEFFFRIHDPTTKNRQGNDNGSQYRSAIFPHDEIQMKEAKEILDEMNLNKWNGKIVTTLELIEPSKFYKAEANHQNYLDKNPGGYCNHRPRW